LGLESRDSLNSSSLDNSEVKIKSILRKTKKEDFELKSIYFLEQSRFKEYLYKKFSFNYARDMNNTLEKIFIKFKVCTLNDLIKLIRKGLINDRASRTSFRVFLNYLEYRELVEEDILLKLRSKVKLSIKSEIDTFVPNDKMIERSLKLISGKDYILYKIVLESGCRPSELGEFIQNFDSSKVEIHNDTIAYRNFYLRNSKNSFYLFFTKKTYLEFIKYKYDLKIFNKFRERIVRNKSIISLKYLRKYQFTLLIKNGVSIEIADFIQGRCSRNIGFNHYLAKKEIALKEYGKIL